MEPYDEIRDQRKTGDSAQQGDDWVAFTARCITFAGSQTTGGNAHLASMRYRTWRFSRLPAYRDNGDKSMLVCRRLRVLKPLDDEIQRPLTHYTLYNARVPVGSDWANSCFLG
jgi:hypothetical protein